MMRTFRTLAYKTGVGDWLEHRAELRRLQHEQSQMYAELSQQYQAAKARGESEDELKKIMVAQYDQRIGSEERIKQAVTWRLLGRADRNGVPTPEFDIDGPEGAWNKGRHSDARYLTPQAFAELRSAIRKEQKERREMWLPLAQWAVTVLSLLVALVAVLKK